jgi:hypothetical protein
LGNAVIKIDRTMKILFFSLIAFLLLAQSAWAEQYTRSYEFKAIHIQRNELLKAANEIFLYLKKINGEAVKSEGYIKLGREDYSAELRLPIEENDYQKFPRIAYHGYLRIEAYQGVISNIQLRLSDSLREAEVTGTSLDHVTGLINVVEEKLKFYECYSGGRGFRFLLGIIAFVLFTSVTLLVLLSNWLHLKDKNQMIMFGLFYVLFNVALYLPPWEKIFPGFLAGIESTSFLERNAALFTFVGFVITILIPVSGLILRLKKPNRHC